MGIGALWEIGMRWTVDLLISMMAGTRQPRRAPQTILRHNRAGYLGEIT